MKRRLRRRLWWLWSRRYRFLFLRDVRMFIQRGRRGWCDEDVWSFDSYIARVISGGLARLAGNNHGWPGEQSRWPEPEDWDSYLLDLSRRLAVWNSDTFTDQDALETTRAAMEEFGREFGIFWD